MRLHNKILVCTSILIVLIISSGLTAQEIYGTWQNAQFGASMTLNADGSYMFNGPYGASSGFWGVQGQIFSMQDQMGNLIQYSIVFYSATELKLLDGNGVPLNYTREASVVDLPAEDHTVLTQSGGYDLTMDHINTGVGIIEFVIGGNIKPQEIEELKQASIDEFSLAPEVFITEVTSLKQSLNQLRSVHDPLTIGVGRQMLVAEFYKVTSNMQPQEIPLLIQVINRYVQVLAFDQTNTLALTDRDASAMISYLEFSNQLNGISRQFTEPEKQQFISDLMQNFQTMPLEQKQFLCSASLAWDLIQNNWARMNSFQQGQFSQQYTQNQAAQYSNTQPGYSTQSYNNNESTQDAIARMRRENIANQNMFNMMNNMSLQNHATMLNTIENFGGTGNYWEVVDY